MADENKSGKPVDKPSERPTPIKSDPFVEIIWLIFSVLTIVYLLNGFLSMLNSSRLFSNGWRGLTPKGIILSHTRPIASLLNPLGVRVISIEETNVYSTPDGKKIGEQKFTSRGKILQGPVDISEKRYWYVDFDNPPDGWVLENNIAYLEREPNILARFAVWILSLVKFFKFFSVSLSIIGIILIIILFKKIIQLRKIERNLLYITNIKTRQEETNPQWMRILSQAESLNENDWKLAILEADIMLSSFLDKLFLPGEGVGEKLKAIEKSDFLTVDNAWEAHKVRNQIAHEGEKFKISQHEAKRVIALYQSVFEEFHIV